MPLQPSKLWEHFWMEKNHKPLPKHSMELVYLPTFYPPPPNCSKSWSTWPCNHWLVGVFSPTHFKNMRSRQIGSWNPKVWGEHSPKKIELPPPSWQPAAEVHPGKKIKNSSCLFIFSRDGTHSQKSLKSYHEPQVSWVFGAYAFLSFFFETTHRPPNKAPTTGGVGRPPQKMARGYVAENSWVTEVIHSLKLTVHPWKWMVGIRSFPFEMAYFQGFIC